MKSVLNGNCLCGAISYCAEGPFADVSSCHCSQCSRWTGGVFSSVNAARASVRIEGEEHLKWYISSPEARRGFCGHCGSSLFWEHQGSGRIAILLGTVSVPTGLEISEHIYVDDKSDYYRICDGKPQFRQDNPGPMAEQSAE